jgi:predicted SprT family Zn-dependent metalloprotease
MLGKYLPEERVLKTPNKPDLAVSAELVVEKYYLIKWRCQNGHENEERQYNLKPRPFTLKCKSCEETLNFKFEQHGQVLVLYISFDVNKKLVISSGT